MSYQPKSYRKFLATSVSAAMVATAFAAVPANVASANEQTSFSDVSAQHWASAEIYRLVNAGIIAGYEDGTFKPGQAIIRGQAATLLAKAADLDIPESVDAAPFSDVSSQNNFAPVLSVMKEVEFIRGHEDGSFRAGEPITREQMASILVRTFGLVDKGEDVTVGDLNSAHSSHQANIEILAQYGITNTADGNFRPKETVQRAQFAAFLDRALAWKNTQELGISGLNFVDANTVEVNFDRELTEADLEALEFGFDPALEVTGKALKEAEVSTSNTGSTVVLTTETQVEGTEYTLVVNGERTNQVATGLPTPPVEEVTDLEVASVSAITSTFVEVNFAALAEAKTEVTVEVKNDKGVVVPVVAQDLAAGQTSAQFDFVTAYTADLEGVWTVNGVEFSFIAIQQLQDILKAVEAGNEVTLLEALNVAGIQNINSELIADYLNAIKNAATTPESLADIQEIINKTNKDSLTAAEKAAIVKALEDANTQVAFLNVLQENFVRVNSNWIVEYVGGKPATEAGNDSEAGFIINVGSANKLVSTSGSNATATEITYDAIQSAIDTLNKEQITVLNDEAKTAVKQSEVTTLIQNYVKDDEGTETAKAEAIAASQLKTAVFRVAESTTQNNLYNNLVALANLEGAGLVATDLNSSLRAEYFAALNATDVKATIVNTPDKATVKSLVVDAADEAALTAALKDIDGITVSTTTATTKALLQKLADVTSHLGTSKFDMSTVVDTRLADYRDALATVAPISPATEITQEQVEAAIASVNSAANEAKNLVTLKDTNATVVEVRNALTELAAGVAANTTTTAYLNASSQVKLEVAQFIIDNRDKLAAELTVGNVTDHEGSAPPNPTYGTHAIQSALADHAAKVAKFNAIGNLESATITSTKAALDEYAYAPYVALTTSQKLAVAEEINKLTKSDGATPPTITPLNFTAPGNDSVSTLAQANAYIDAAIAVVTGN